MKSILDFIKTTVVGGALFLVPIIVILAILGRAHQISAGIVTPLLRLVSVEALSGPVAIRLFAVALIVLFCFLAGLYARTSAAKKSSSWLENNVLSHVPGYSLVKSLTSSIAGSPKQDGHQPVLARIEDAWQIGFLVERLDAGHMAVFVPGAPNAMSGSVYFMTEDRVKPLDVPLQKAMKCVQRFGDGSAALLAGKL